jgi:NAD(P)-dependent dehydrogenase (short-subunit alcohol dehydrogenase family)
MVNTPVTVVTGGALGIGKAAVEALLEADADRHIVAVDLNETALKILAGRFANRITPVIGDVGEWATHLAAAEVAAATGTLTGWVNNAGFSTRGRAHEVTPEDIQAGTRVMQFGTMYGTCIAVRNMIKTGGGAIVNVASIQGSVAFPNQYVYQGTKAAIIMITKGVATEYGHVNIRCNSVSPGAIRTVMGRPDVTEDDLAHETTNPDDVLSPMNRVAAPREVAMAIRWLLSDEASFVTGEDVKVDGGATARCYAYPPVDLSAYV